MVNRATGALRRFAAGVVAVVFAASIAWPAAGSQVLSAYAVSAGAAADVGEVAIVFTNDVHCGVEDGLGYAGVAAFAGDAEASFGADNVTLVDAGDAVQGDVLGTLTDGAAIIEIMNYLDYDYAVPGNHEYDYGMDRFFEIVDESTATYLSCNFTDLRTGSAPLASYAIETYEDIVVDGDDLDVAYVGITTPSTLTSSTPVSFQDETGAYVYGFCEDATGQALYAVVQAAVDAAIAEGADYVVAVGHLGETGSEARWSSDAVIANTTGIDAFIDGHSHERYVKTVANEDGIAVPLAQTGTKLAAVGQLVIDPDADEAAGEAEVSFTLATAESYAARDAGTQTLIDGIMAEFEQELVRVVGTTEYALVSADEATGVYVRYQETNLGDLVADAYRAAFDADIGIANGGGVRSALAAGDVTYADLISVQPFGNELSLVQATGQQILDALEVGVSEYPEPSGGFLQVSGLSYTVRTDIASSVVFDEHSAFVGVDGPRRVENVLVGGEPINPNATYTVASHGYLLFEGGNGMSMFASCRVLIKNAMIDNQALINYITDDLDGVIGAAYANPEGEGRITFADGPSAPADDPTAGTEGEGAEGGSGGSASTGGAADTTGASGSGSGAALAQTGDATVASVAVLFSATCAAVIVAIVGRIRVTRC